MSSFRILLKQLGPGLLFAGAAIGVSHLVQSTRAGALFGFDLVWAIVLIHIVKYPFFHYGPRYVAATGESLLEGYRKLGKWVLVFFVGVSLVTAFTIQAAVTVVTAGIVGHLFGIALPAWQMSGLILGLLALLLMFEKFSWLDRSMKVIILTLTLSTIIAVVAGMSKGYAPVDPIPFRWEPVGIIFLITLMGWMPSPIDLSVWVSLWNQAKNRQLGQRLSLRHTLRDFNLGYWGTMAIALFFLVLGAMAMHGKGITLHPRGDLFAGQLIDLYTGMVGPWIYWVVAIAALTTMVSTTLTCFDAIPRVLERSTRLLAPASEGLGNNLYRLYLLVLGAGAVFILAQFGGSMQAVVNLATILSFLTAPLLAVLNYVVMVRLPMERGYRPSLLLHVLSWFGIAFLVAFSVLYLWTEFG